MTKDDIKAIVKDIKDSILSDKKAIEQFAINKGFYIHNLPTSISYEKRITAQFPESCFSSFRGTIDEDTFTAWFNITYFKSVAREQISLISLNDKKCTIKVKTSLPTDSYFLGYFGLTDGYNNLLESFQNGNNTYQLMPENYEIIKSILFQETEETTEIIERITNDHKKDYKEKKKEKYFNIHRWIHPFIKVKNSRMYNVQVNINLIKQYLEA